jgi:hypothetical protein
MTCYHKQDGAHDCKILWPSIPELTELVNTIPTSQVAKQLGVSDVAVAKFCANHNIKKPGRGYWKKKDKPNQ